MSITPTPYESFSTPSQSTVPSGAWSLWSVGDLDDCEIVPNSARPLTSDPNHYDIECDVFSPLLQTVYYPTLEANISINLTNYGGATSLDFAWTYWPVYFGPNVTGGTSIPVRSKVGDVGFDDSFLTIAFADSGINPWTNASKISHSGSTSVVRGSDPTIGYIPLLINVTMSTATVPNPTGINVQEIYYWVQDIGINITTPLQRSTSAAPSVTTFPSSGSSSPSSSTMVPIGVVVGATVGVVVFITLIVVALLFRSRRERARGHMADETTFNEPANHEDPLPNEGEGPTQPPWIGSNSAQAVLVGMVEPNDRLTTPWTEGIVSSTPSLSVLNKPNPPTGLVAGTTSGIGSSGQQTSGSNGLPAEIYGWEESVRQDRTMPPSLSPEPAQFASTSRSPPPSFISEPVQFTSTSATLPPLFSPELARFASANRDVINENLEARLQAAAYLPTDDPSDLTPEQWRNEHGVNRLELKRLKNLYAQNNK